MPIVEGGPMNKMRTHFGRILRAHVAHTRAQHPEDRQDRLPRLFHFLKTEMRWSDLRWHKHLSRIEEGFGPD